MQIRINSYFIFLLIITIVNSYATSISFTFGNQQITGTNPKYYEFDIMVAAGTSGTKIGAAQAYINYNINGFGSNIVNNNKVTITKGSLINNPYYSITAADNTSSRIGITSDYHLSSSPELGSDLPTTPTQWIHVKIEIFNQSQTAGLSFEQPLMVGQEKQSDNTPYDPVIANDIDDSSLPVTLANFNSNVSESKVLIKWTTESEINNLGFEIYRSEFEEGEYLLLSSYASNPDLLGQGNSTQQHEYSYVDETAEPGKTYWYKLADVDFNGKRTFHGPISATLPNLPKAFKMYPNYPNPFNPSTTFKFDVPQLPKGNTRAKLEIYNILGQLVKVVFDKKIEPGTFQVQWNGLNQNGNQVSSGIYFAIFRSKEFVRKQKITLIR